MACVDSVPERRPKMVEVVHMLEDIHQVLDTKDEPSRHSESEDRSNKSPQSVRDSLSDTPSSVMQTPSAYTPSDWFQNHNKEGKHPHPTPSHGQIVVGSCSNLEKSWKLSNARIGTIENYICHLKMSAYIAKLELSSLTGAQDLIQIQKVSAQPAISSLCLYYQFG
jgi:hypothetical protein